MDTIYIILIVIFIIIFLATAVLTICALPGWIKIPNNYLKILFSSLLLEVIACVFLVFNLVRPSDHKCEDKLSHLKTDRWVILNESGSISQLCVNDTVPVGKGIDDFFENAKGKEMYHLAKENRKYFVKNDFAQCLGKLKDSTFSNLDLTEILTFTLPQDAFRRIKYVQNNSGWSIKPKEGSPDPFDQTLPGTLKIKVTGNSYTVSDIDTSFYNKEITGGDCFDLGKRVPHFFKGSDYYYYLVQITDAKTSGEKPYHVTFTAIRLKTELN
jgi:hypothetical protein